jgi:hypothetical protein
MFNFSEALSELRDSMISVVLLVAAAIIGLAWMSIGLFNALSLWLGPIWGPIMLGAAMTLPLLVYVIFRLSRAKSQKQNLSFLKQQTHSAYEQSSVLHISRIIEGLSTTSPLMATLGAIGAGFLATRFPALLQVVSEVITAWADDVKRKRSEKEAEQ